MKKSVKIISCVILVLLAIVAFVLMTQYYYAGLSSWNGRYYERVCYGVWCLTLAVFFGLIIGRIKPIWAKVPVGVLFSLAFTLTVFLSNNFWRYLSINSDLGWEEAVSYGTVLKWDALFINGTAWLRYPTVFIITSVLCSVIIFLTHPSVKQWYKSKAERLRSSLLPSDFV